MCLESRYPKKICRRTQRDESEIALQVQGMLRVLERLGAKPWEDEFYPPGEAFRIECLANPDTIIRKVFPEFACKRAGMPRLTGG